MTTKPLRSATECDPHDDADARLEDEDFHLAANDQANALVEIVVARIRRTSSGVFETVDPVTKKHRAT